MLFFFVLFFNPDRHATTLNPLSPLSLLSSSDAMKILWQLLAFS